MAMPAIYSRYAVGVLDVIKDIFVYPDAYQTWDMEVALPDPAHNRVVFCRSAKTRNKATTEFQQSVDGGKAAAASFADFRAAMDAFAANSVFLAWNGQPAAAGEVAGDAVRKALGGDGVSLASVRVMYRKKGAPSKQAQVMRFIALPDARAATQYVLDLDGRGLDLLVKEEERPLDTATVHEWK